MNMSRFHRIVVGGCALGIVAMALVVYSNNARAEADRQGRASAAAGNPYKHESLLAQPAGTSLSESTSPDLLAEMKRLPVAYDMSSLPVIRDSSGKLRVAEQPAAPKEGTPGGPELSLDGSTRAIYVLGGEDLITYWYMELALPSYMTDADGGTIRLIMQHESDGYDQVRIIDEHIGTEYVDNTYGNRGRYPGRYGWTRQSGGGEWAWILGDWTAHNIATPWDWAWIVDYRFLQGNSVLAGDTIRIYSHPHVTTRVIFKD